MAVMAEQAADFSAKVQVIVIGGGAGGLIAALRLRDAGVACVA